MSSALVSVITPVYNSGRFIAASIRSVQSQSLADWEMIIVDDCSSDDSVAIVEGFAARDGRIRLLRLPENAGPAVARNAAIQASSGRYIAFLDSDDLWLPDKLDKQIEFMQSHGHAFTYSHYEQLTEAGDRTGRRIRPPARLSYGDMLKSNQIGCLTAVFDTDRLGRVLMPPIRKRQDYGLWLRLLKLEPWAYCLPEVVALYRLRADSLSSNKLEMLRYNWQLYRRMENFSVLRSSYYLGWNLVRKVLA